MIEGEDEKGERGQLALAIIYGHGAGTTPRLEEVWTQESEGARA